MNKFFKEILLTFLGTAISGLGMGSFLLPNKLSSGGLQELQRFFIIFLVGM